MHPLTTKKSQLTDALNATLRTFNGNELVLLNDMGNTLILDSTTGNIMGLRDGFVPLGMKEHGGILYIASFNPTTKYGELGTIPSPLITYNYSKTPYVTTIDLSISADTILQNSYQVSDKLFLVGDLFIINVNIENVITKRKVWEYLENTLDTSAEHTYNLLTGFKENTEEKDYGWFNLILEAKTQKSTDTVNLSYVTDNKLYYYIEDNLDRLESHYWFINNTRTLNLDTDRCLADNCYKTYPNILPGYLYIKTELETPDVDSFRFFVNESTGLRSPIFFSIVLQ